LPRYIVNATRLEHISEAMKWASQRNIRIVVKGTGHDLNGRYVISEDPNLHISH
jgi:FAD/FMN-containing dehydrogenase